MYDAPRLRNFYMRLKECGYRQVTAHRLENHFTIMSRTVHFNKCYNFLPAELNIFENIVLSARIELPESYPFRYNERRTLREVYSAVTRIFLKQRLEITYTEVSRMFSRMPTLNNRSINYIGQMIDLLQHEFNYSIKRIIESKLLDGHLEVLEELVKRRHLCGVDVRAILHSTPHLLRSYSENILEIEKLIMDYRIPTSAVRCCKSIFTMHPNTVAANLRYIRELPLSLDAFENPLILRLTHELNNLKKYLDLCKSERQKRIPMEKFVK